MARRRRDTERARIDAILDAVCREPIVTGPVSLTDEYLAMVREVEENPANASGAEKDWLQRSDREFREYYERHYGRSLG